MAFVILDHHYLYRRSVGTFASDRTHRTRYFSVEPLAERGLGADDDPTLKDIALNDMDRPRVPAVRVDLWANPVFAATVLCHLYLTGAGYGPRLISVIYQTNAVMSMKSTVGVAKTGVNSLRSTVPHAGVVFLDLKDGDQLEWKMEFIQGARILQVRKAVKADERNDA